jgi:hypothetical protein
MEINTLKLNCFHGIERKFVHLQNKFNENCLQCFMLNELHGEKFHSRWKKMTKWHLQKEHSINVKRKTKAKKNCKIRKTKNLSRWKKSKKMQNRCTMCQLYKMNNAFKENLWKHKEKMLQSWQICKITTKEKFEWVISPKTPITMKKSLNK